LAIDPTAFAAGFGDRIATLAEAIEMQEGARLPGARRMAARKRTEAEGVEIDDALALRLGLKKN
jgi:(2R)-3-sulfolactate dehydrogenase (NADP+)